MQNKFNFWGTLVTPWARRNPLLVSLYVLVLICVILNIACIASGEMYPNMMWLFLIPAIFYVITLIVGSLVDRLRKELPSNSLLQTDCMIVNDMLETPGIAHLEDNGLILKPLIGNKFRFQLLTSNRLENGNGITDMVIGDTQSFLNFRPQNNGVLALV